MVEIRFLRGIVLLTKRKQPVLNHAGGELVEAPDLIDRQSHPVGDRLEQFAVIDFPAQSLADQPGDRTTASAGFPADADILEPRRRAHGILRLAILLALSQEPANHGPWPVPEARAPRCWDSGVALANLSHADMGGSPPISTELHFSLGPGPLLEKGRRCHSRPLS